MAVYSELPDIIEPLLCIPVILSMLPDLVYSKFWLPRLTVSALIALQLLEVGRHICFALLLKLMMSFDPETRVKILLALIVVTHIRFLHPWQANSHCNPSWKFVAIALGHAAMSSSLPLNTMAIIIQYPDLLSAQECAFVTASAEAHGRRHGWTTRRHGKYSTEDIPLQDIDALRGLDMVIEKRIAHVAQRHFHGKLVAVDTFVVRFTEGHQVALEWHRDGAEVTYNVALSSSVDYLGSGVHFPSAQPEGVKKESLGGLVIRPPLGSVLLHPAKLLHESVNLNQGTRYVLISLNHVYHENWSWFASSFFNFYGLFAQRLELFTGDKEELRWWPWKRV